MQVVSCKSPLKIKTLPSRLQSLPVKKKLLFRLKKVQFSFLTTTDSEFARDERREKDAFWQSQKDKGHIHETIKHVEINAKGGLTINAGKGIIIEYKKADDFNAAIDQLAESPGLTWLAELKNDPRVNWKEVEARYENWDHESQGLTQAGAILVSIIVSAVSGGALSALSAELAVGLGFAADGVTQIALQAGLNSIANQASIALINNQGDIGATLETLGSSDSLRSLATAMIAAGLTVYITDIAGIEAHAPDATIVQDIQKGLVRATVNASVSKVIQGGELGDNLVAALRMEAASIVGEKRYKGNR